MGSHQSQTCGYHPEGNSITERENKVIVDMLSHYVSRRQDDWDEFLPVVMMAFRSSVHRTLGETPAAMVFGRALPLPLDALVGPPPEAEYLGPYAADYAQRLADALQDAHAVVRERLGQYYRYQTLQYNRRVSANYYYIGQAVWMFQHNKTKTMSKKLMKPWVGPYIVVGRVNDVVYAVQLKRGVVRCLHGNRLKPFYAAVED